jgi:multiple sugar transport system substrate-binding protein
MIRLTRLAPLLPVALAISLSLGACQGDAPVADKDNPYGNLAELDPNGALVVYWHALTGTDEERLLEMTDDFNASNEWNITVVGEYQGDLEALYARVTAGLPTGQLPSLVMTDPSLAAAYAAQDAALALSPYLESKKWGFTRTELDDFFSSALTSEGLPQFKNEHFSFPSCRSLQILYYNADWLKELGYDAPPQTWDEFREIACTASKPADGLYGLEFGMDSSLFVSLLVTQDAAILNESATIYTMGGAQGQAALQFLQDLIQDGCALWETEEGPLADFGAGKVLFTVGSTVELPAYRRVIAEDANFDWSLSVLPHTREEAVVGVYGTSLTILRGTPKEQLAAWLFIKWLAEPEQQARWSQETGCFPTRRSALDAMDDYLAEQPQYSLASQLLESEWGAEPAVTAYATCRSEIGRMLYAVTAGEGVNQWLTDTQTFCNQTLTGLDSP